MVTKEMCIADVAGFDTFSSARAMVLRRKSYGFERLELTGHELTGEFFRNYSWGEWVGIARTLYII